jgi:hypothetical protein
MTGIRLSADLAPVADLLVVHVLDVGRLDLAQRIVFVHDDHITFFDRFFVENAKAFFEQEKYDQENSKTCNGSTQHQQTFNKSFREPFVECFQTSHYFFANLTAQEPVSV